MFKRLDTHLWNENKIFLGTILFLGIKITGVLFGLIICFIGLKTFIKKSDNKNNPEINKKIKFFSKLGPQIILFSLGIRIKIKKNENFSYSKHLGENYKSSNAHPSLHISNHTSWIDILVFMSLIGSGFVAKKDVKNYPLIGFIAQCIGSIFVDREDKNSVVETLKMVIEKQKNNYEGNDLSTFLLFPEGTTSNNTGILNLKKGAFISELPIKPYVIKFDPINNISLAMDVIDMLYHLLLLISVPMHYIEVIELPVFCPNENLFKDKSKERWLQYAEAIRDVMCKASGLNEIKGGYKEKKEYLEFLRDEKRDKIHSD